MAVRAARPHPFRPTRYVAAGVLGGVVVLLATAASLANAVLSSAPLLVLAFGLPALALGVAGGFMGLKALGEHGPARQTEAIWAAVLLAVGFVAWVLVAEAAWLLRQGPLTTVLFSALACVPTTAFGLWVLRRLDRNEKEPWRLVLVAVVWGAVIATTLAAWGNSLWNLLLGSNLPPGPAYNQSLGFSAGIVEELSKGAAVVLLYLVMRNEFDDIVDGIIYGAAVGLGFNYLESILYMTRASVELHQIGAPAFAGAAYQWGFRQVLSLFTGHTTYTALVGAGIGIARQMPRLHQRVLSIVAGFLAAIAGHMVFDAWIASGAVPSDGLLGLLYVIFREIVGGGAFTAVVLLLLGMGLRAEGNALERHLAEEAATGLGAVLPEEIPILVSPWRRFRERADALTMRGFLAWVDVRRLRHAQLDLAMERWHRSRKEIDRPLEAEEILRRRVLALRAELGPPPPRRQPPPAWQRP